MTPTILNFIERTLMNRLRPTDKVFELGALDFNGSVRSVIQQKVSHYHGVDKQSGPGVDQTINADEDLANIGSGQFNCVICCETLEHTPNPWYITEQLKRVIADGGLLLISTPTYGFPLHRYPIDCYRFGEDAFREFLFKDYEILNLETVHDSFGPFPIICCLGKKH